jgi:predicted O-methyltransferase YrrM
MLCFGKLEGTFMSQGSLLQKTKRTIKTEGWGSFTKKAWGRIDGKLTPAKRVFAPSAIRAMAKLDQSNRDVVALVNFIFDRFGGLIRPAQIRSEITDLAAIVKDLKPKTVMEIGTANGGSLFLFSRLADPNATIVSVDLPGGRFGGGYPAWKIKLYQAFHLSGQKMDLLRVDSHSSETLEKVKNIFHGVPVDFLFIDGDHTYQGVKKDFELYSPLVRKGGVIAFHDIVIHPRGIDCDVDKLWNEIKKSDSRELIGSPNQNWAGIGVYFVS